MLLGINQAAWPAGIGIFGPLPAVMPLQSVGEILRYAGIVRIIATFQYIYKPGFHVG